MGQILSSWASAFRVAGETAAASGSALAAGVTVTSS